MLSLRTPLKSWIQIFSSDVPLSLASKCRLVIRGALSDTRPSSIASLGKEGRGSQPCVGARLEEFLNFLSWDPSLFDPSDPVESLTYRVLVSACKEASATLASTQTHPLAAHWKQQNRKYMEAHKAKRDKELGAGGEPLEKTGRGERAPPPPTDCTGERGAVGGAPGGERPPPPPPPPPPKPRPGLIPA